MTGCAVEAVGWPVRLTVRSSNASCSKPPLLCVSSSLLCTCMPCIPGLTYLNTYVHTHI